MPQLALSNPIPKLDSTQTLLLALGDVAIAAFRIDLTKSQIVGAQASLVPTADLDELSAALATLRCARQLVS